MACGRSALQDWVITRPTQHAPQLQQAAHLCAANLTDPSAVHQPYSVLPASQQQLAGWEQVPLTGRRPPQLPPAGKAQQWWLWRLAHGLEELAWAGVAMLPQSTEQGVKLWKTWGRMLPSGACLALPQTVGVGSHAAAGMHACMPACSLLLLRIATHMLGACP